VAEAQPFSPATAEVGIGTYGGLSLGRDRRAVVSAPSAVAATALAARDETQCAVCGAKGSASIVATAGGPCRFAAGGRSDLQSQRVPKASSSLLKNLKSSAFVLRFSSSYKRSVRFGSECSRLVATLSYSQPTRI
jgi:hypothetical protein